MAAVSSFGPLRDRLYEALTTETGQQRALGAAALFHRGYPPGVPARVRSPLALEGPTVFVATERRESILEDAELGSEHLYITTIVLSRDYHLGWWGTGLQGRSTSRNELENTILKAEDAFPAIRAALCYPNAHDTVDETGAATGLAGIRGGGATSEMRVEIVSDEARLLNVQDRFTAWVAWNPGS